MYINTCVYVVKHVPAEMVGVFIHHEIVAAIPAPIRTHGPVPIRYLEVEAAREPEAVMVAVDAFDVVAVRRAEMFEAPVLKRMVKVKTLVVGAIVPIPMVVADVLGFIDFAVYVTFRLGFSVRRLAMRRWRRNPPLVGSWRVIARLRMLRFRPLPFGVSTFRMLRVNTRWAEYQACAQQQQRLTSHPCHLTETPSDRCRPTHEVVRIVSMLSRNFIRDFLDL